MKGVAAAAVPAAGAYALQTYSVEQLDSGGWVVLPKAAAAECAEGGGCSIWSEKGLRAMNGAWQLYGWKEGRRTAPDSCSAPAAGI